MSGVIQNRDSMTNNGGILMPLLNHKWAIDTTLPDELNSLLREQTVKCVINIVRRELILEVHQPATYANRMFHIIQLLSKGKTNMAVQCIDNGEFVDMVGIEATLVNHECEFNYSLSSDVVTHNLTFNF